MPIAFLKGILVRFGFSDNEVHISIITSVIIIPQGVIVCIVQAGHIFLTRLCTRESKSVYVWKNTTILFTQQRHFLRNVK